MYYYKVKIQKKQGVTREKQGVIPANSPQDAMDLMEEMAEGWGVTIIRCSLHEVNEDGELVLITTKEPGPKSHKQEELPLTHKNVYRPVQPLPPYPQPHSFGSQWTSPVFKTKHMEDTK